MPQPRYARIGPASPTARATFIFLIFAYAVVGVYLSNFLAYTSSGILWLILMLIATVAYAMDDYVWRARERIFGINPSTIFSSLVAGLLGGLAYIVLVAGLPALSIGAPAAVIEFPFAIDSKFVSIVILAPIVEEPLFRGAFYTAAYNVAWNNRSDRTRAIVIGAVVVSVFFALYHTAVYSQSIEAQVALGQLSYGEAAGAASGSLLGAFLFSMVAVGINERTESILPGMVMHMMMNGAFFFSGRV